LTFQVAGRCELPWAEMRLMQFTRTTVDPRQMGGSPCTATGISLLSSPADSGASLQLARMKREVLAHLELHPVDLRQKT
jgi:hypothetical protein